MVFLLAIQAMLFLPVIQAMAFLPAIQAMVFLGVIQVEMVHRALLQVILASSLLIQRWRAAVAHSSGPG
jgi:hypothetical protein